MSSNPQRLLQFRKNIYSQTGEDGIIEKILNALPITDKWCVEFGAWDGCHLSNTRNLVESCGYSAVLIEGNSRKAKKLTDNYSSNKNIYPINAFVGFNDIDGLDVLLKDTPIPHDFDFLSIDIDSNDYHVWKALKNYRPKLVCVEYNQTIPTHIEFVQEANPKINQGNSILSMCKLAKEKDYELICALKFNLFFVRKEYYHLFNIEDNSPAVMRPCDEVTYLFSGLDGSIILHGSLRLPWHEIMMRPRHLQYLPRCLRKFPGNFNLLDKFLYAVFVFFYDRSTFKRQFNKFVLKKLHQVL